ncbi:MAG: hypothetical protein IJ068_03175 [Bacilli bacterium]|nr:hypothetical protein [Bacilli bacterium]
MIYINETPSHHPSKEEMQEFYAEMGEAMLKMERAYLLFEEKRILSLYREFLKKEYDVTNTKVLENNELINHVEMQNVIYLVDKLLRQNNYTFVMESNGPKSFDLNHRLEMMDINKNLIKAYYSTFDSNIYSHDTVKKMGEFYQIQQVQEIVKFIKSINNILNKEKGLYLLSNLTFIGKEMLPNASFSEINAKLQELNSNFNNNLLNEYAYNVLSDFELINHDDYLNGKVKRLTY